MSTPSIVRGIESSFLAETYDESLPTHEVHEGFSVERVLRHGDRSVHRFGAELARRIAAKASSFDALWFNGNPGEFWTTAWIRPQQATAISWANGSG